MKLCWGLINFLYTITLEGLTDYYKMTACSWLLLSFLKTNYLPIFCWVGSIQYFLCVGTGSCIRFVSCNNILWRLIYLLSGDYFLNNIYIMQGLCHRIMYMFYIIYLLTDPFHSYKNCRVMQNKANTLCSFCMVLTI